MKHLLSIASLAALLAPAASAQGTVDLIGIYTANDGTRVSNLALTPGPENIATAYVCMTGVSDLQGVSAWEMTLSGLSPADGVVVTSWDLVAGPGSSGPPLNIMSPPEFIVGATVGPSSSPIPWSPEVCIMSFDFFVLDANPKAFFISEAPFPSLPGVPVYVGGSSVGTLVPMAWDYGSSEEFVAFTVNSAGSVTPRDGVLGTNPVAFHAPIAPHSGTPWEVSVDLTPTPGHATLGTLVVAGFGGPMQGVPLLGHELLISPPYFIHGGQGVHELPVPAGLTGTFFSAQGARLELTPGGDLSTVLTNAQDVVIG